LVFAVLDIDIDFWREGFAFFAVRMPVSINQLIHFEERKRFKIIGLTFQFARWAD